MVAWILTFGRSCGNINEGQSAACSRLIAFAEHHPQNASAALYAAESIPHQPGEPDLNRAERMLKNAMLEKAIALRFSYASAHSRLFRAYPVWENLRKRRRKSHCREKYKQQETKQLDQDLKNVSIFRPASGK